MKVQIPRIMLAAPGSGCGKTTITCGLLQVLINRGDSPSAFKCGPDYIDPMFHKYVLGVTGGNLDSFFLNREEILRQLAEGSQKKSQDSMQQNPQQKNSQQKNSQQKNPQQQNPQQQEISVIEGVMGYFDGVGGISTWASSFDLARITETPVILIVDCKGASLSLVAVIQGFLQYERERALELVQERGPENVGNVSGNQIKGILLNRISPVMADRLKPEIERLGVAVVGCIPECDEMQLESRHLGLVRPEEISSLRTQMEQLAERIAKTVDIDKICGIAQSAPALVIQKETKEEVQTHLRIGVARDSAFCFYYQENLRLLESMGAELVPFSPMKDRSLPADIDGMILGGGYPELYASELSSNTSMIEAVKSSINSGMPYLAECGGFLYLHQELEASDGVFYPMAGVIDGTGYRTKRLSRFGYISLAPATEDQCFKQEIKGHEFHYWDSTNCGEDWKASKPLSSRGWNCIHGKENQIAGFPHLYYPSNPAFVKIWLDGCRRYQDNRSARITKAGNNEENS